MDQAIAIVSSIVGHGPDKTFQNPISHWWAEVTPDQMSAIDQRRMDIRAYDVKLTMTPVYAYKTGNDQRYSVNLTTF